jgi:glyoxylase-like metal-dependent hydrolase (beta-lactamase superfamily II)
LTIRVFDMEERMKRVLMALALALFTATALAQAKTEVLWLGQAAFRITTPGGKVSMIDPWMRTNPKTPANFKDLHAVGKIDLILVTHAHFDHFADAPDLAKMHEVPMYGPAWAIRWTRSVSCRPSSRRASARAARSSPSVPTA